MDTSIYFISFEFLAIWWLDSEPKLYMSVPCDLYQEALKAECSVFIILTIASGQCLHSITL